MEKRDIKILVVDDEEDITHFTARILEYDGFDVCTALDGASALEVFEKECPDICLLDVHLGYSKIDGMEVLEKIKQTDEKTECIMITRITDHETMKKAKELGVKDYFFKPIAMDEWLDKVRAVAEEIKERKTSG